VVVFLVALPLCLGIALACGAPLVAGLVSGVVGGMLVSWLSGSHTSVSGPAAGMVAVVLAQVVALKSYEAFLVAVILAGAIQVLLGACRAGFIAAFFPSNVIKGLLAAIGLILILKQIPHAVGHDADPEGDLGFLQPDGRNTLSELFSSVFNFEPGATAVGLVSLAILLAWDRSRLKRSLIPAPLVVVLLGVAANSGDEGRRLPLGHRSEPLGAVAHRGQPRGVPEGPAQPRLQGHRQSRGHPGRRHDRRRRLARDAPEPRGRG